MRTIHFFITLGFLLSATCSFSQDTTAIYFNTGSHKLSSHSQKVIASTFQNLDYNSISSISFIGFSDSSGNIASNQRLSERRAKTVFKASEDFFKEKIAASIESKGEVPRIVDSLSRRVDIVIFYHQQSDYNENDTIHIQPNDPRCFFIDQYLDGISFAGVEVSKRKEVVKLEILNLPQFTDRKYYYVRNPNQKNAVAQRVNFKLETTGSLWWREKRLTATIPKNSYDKFGLFYLEEPPCNGCKEQVFKQDTVIFTRLVVKTDYFTMSVTQLKTKLFRPNIVKLRAPKVYVLDNTQYYVETIDFNSNLDQKRISWEEKRGRRKEDYYYSSVKIKDVKNISVARPMRTSYCPDYKDNRYFRNGGNGFNCGGIRGEFPFPGKLSLMLSLNTFFHNDTLTAFMALGVGYELKNHQLLLQVGLNHRVGLYSSFSYHYNYAHFQLMKNRLLDPWQKAQQSEFTSQITLYAGPEIRTNYIKKYRSFVELNLHTGFSFESRSGFGYYFHGGIARDLSNRINTGFYPYIQAGIRFSIF